MKFLLEIITPQRQAFAEEVDEVLVPTPNGLVGVLAQHEPLFSALSDGEIKITTGSKEFFLAIGGGFMEVTSEKVSILVTRAVHADELNEVEIKKAYESAKHVIASKATGEELSQAQAMMHRSVLELKTIRRKNRHMTGLPTAH